MNEAHLRNEGTLTGTLDPRAHQCLIGQTRALNQIINAFNSKRFPHAWLLCGQNGIGKATLAWHVARELTERGEISANGMVGEDVLARFGQNNHPRVYSLTCPPDEKKGFKTNIPIENVRELIQNLQLASVDDHWRAVIIDPMEALTTAANNAILKLLEEPPSRVIFFLISHAPSKLLPTIRSRCQMLRLEPLSKDDMRVIWPAVSSLPLPSADVFEIAEGSIRDAFLASDRLLEMWQMGRSILQKAPKLDVSEMLAFSKFCNTGNRAESALLASKFFSGLAGSMIRSGIGEGAQDFPPVVTSSEKLVKWSEFAFETVSELDRVIRLNLDVEVAIFHRWLAIETFLKL